MYRHPCALAHHASPNRECARRFQVADACHGARADADQADAGHRIEYERHTGSHTLAATHLQHGRHTLAATHLQPHTRSHTLAATHLQSHTGRHTLAAWQPRTCSHTLAATHSHPPSHPHTRSHTRSHTLAATHSRQTGSHTFAATQTRWQPAAYWSTRPAHAGRMGTGKERNGTRMNRTCGRIGGHGFVHGLPTNPWTCG